MSKDEKTEREVDISEVREVVNKHFPEMWQAVQTCLAVTATLLPEESSDPIGLNLQGPPSSEKTTVLSFFYGIEGVTFKTDNFTPKSFVSHAANLKEEELQKVDLLPKIKDKTIIVPELAPVLGKRKEDLLENLSILTRLFDGEGLESDSGLRGHRGYSGDYLFAWLGATTPLYGQVWRVMGKLGNRFLFMNIGAKNKKSEQLKKIMTDISFKRKVAECRDIVHRFAKSLYGKYKPGTIKWDQEKDNDTAREVIVGCAELVRRLRGAIESRGAETDEGKKFVEYAPPLIEDPERLIMQLYALAKGNAIINGRNYVTEDDIYVVVPVALSSMPFNRYQVFQLLLKHTSFNPKIASELLKCSERHARRVLYDLELLGLVTLDKDKSVLGAEIASDVKGYIGLVSKYADGFVSVSPSGHKNDSVSENREQKDNTASERRRKEVMDDLGYKTRAEFLAAIESDFKKIIIA